MSVFLVKKQVLISGRKNRRFQPPDRKKKTSCFLTKKPLVLKTGRKNLLFLPPVFKTGRKLPVFTSCFQNRKKKLPVFTSCFQNRKKNLLFKPSIVKTGR